MPAQLFAKNAPVAQLDRASDYESEGRTFESFRARHFRSTPGRAGISHHFASFAALFPALVGGRWNVALKLHSVVQDADNLDRRLGCNPVHQDVTSATSVSRDVERAKTPHDLVSAPGPRNVRTVRKFGDRLNERVPINSCLSGTEILGGPFQDIRKIELCGSAETNTPFLLGHEAAIPMFGK